MANDLKECRQNIGKLVFNSTTLKCFQCKPITIIVIVQWNVYGFMWTRLLDKTRKGLTKKLFIFFTMFQFVMNVIKIFIIKITFFISKEVIHI